MTLRYRQLAADLRDRIAAGEYPPGARLPAIDTIAHDQGMSRDTVHTAIRLLEAQGIVQAVHGSGVVVLDQRPVQVALSRYASVMRPGGDLGPWETACQQTGITGRMHLIEVETVSADDEVTTALELLPAGRRIVRRSRHAVVDDPEQVVQLHTASYPAKLVRGTPIARDARIDGGVYGAFVAAGIIPATATETVGARPATDEEIAELRLRGQLTVLTVQRVTRDTGGRPIEYLQIAADPARTVLKYDDLPLQPPA
ncbi:MAG: GntR family transcriptional regulator [Streptosporangiaceae bacterium]|jgi:GntR family transcriptional regulator